MKTINYSQPEFYHFSQDSIELAKFAAKYWADEEIDHLIDMFCGCGVVGIEFFFRHSKIQKLEFIEREKEFYESIESNLKKSKRKMDYEIKIIDIAELDQLPSESYILANPPYFLEGSGRPAGNEKKHHANFTSAECWNKWMEQVRGHEVLFLGRVKAEHIKKDTKIKLVHQIDDETAIFTLSKNS